MTRYPGLRSSTAMLVLGGLALSGCSKDDCDEKGGPLSADELSWFCPEGAQATFKLMGADSTQVITTGPLNIVNVPGRRSVEEHCNWIFERGNQSLGVDVAVFVSHFGIGCESNENSASLGNGSFYTRFSELIAQDHLLLNGVEHNGVYVIPGAAYGPTDIWYSRSEGLLAFTKNGERWTRQ
ncbi:MAG: hypothetical protein JNM91_10925 [Flavobacteriales bacterium]|nr:hypothetical protein [Flavobacteriales bacterium]